MNLRLATFILSVCLSSTVSNGEEPEGNLVGENMEDSSEPRKCYQCKGGVDSDCGENVKEVGSHHLKPCNAESWEGEDDLCRVIHQEVRGVVTFIRSCGYEKYKGKKEEACYKTLHQEYNTHVCQCFHDGCNGVPGFHGSLVLGLVALAVALLFK